MGLGFGRGATGMDKRARYQEHRAANDIAQASPKARPKHSTTARGRRSRSMPRNKGLWDHTVAQDKRMLIFDISDEDSATGGAASGSGLTTAERAQVPGVATPQAWPGHPGHLGQSAERGRADDSMMDDTTLERGDHPEGQGHAAVRLFQSTTHKGCEGDAEATQPFDSEVHIRHMQEARQLQPERDAARDLGQLPMREDAAPPPSRQRRSSTPVGRLMEAARAQRDKNERAVAAEEERNNGQAEAERVLGEMEKMLAEGPYNADPTTPTKKARRQEAATPQKEPSSNNSKRARTRGARSILRRTLPSTGKTRRWRASHHDCHDHNRKGHVWNKNEYQRLSRHNKVPRRTQ